MAAPKKQSAYTASQKELLARIENASTETPGYLLVNEKDPDVLALWANDQGPIQLNQEIRSGVSIAARPRQVKPNGAEPNRMEPDGEEMARTKTEPTAPPVTITEAKSGTGLKFELDGVGEQFGNLPNFFPEPEKTVRKPEYYPFSKLENIGESFIVIATEQYPEPWKTLRSAVNAQNKKNSSESGEFKKGKNGKPKPVMLYTKKFEIRKVNAGDTYTNGFVEKHTGARIYRSK